MHHRSRILVVACMLVAALACVPAVMGATLQAPLVLHAVDTAAFPSVRIGVTLPAGIISAGETPTFDVSENGRRVADVTVESVSTSRNPIDVVLLVDASGSMAGRPIADARSAAKRFVQSMADGDRIAVLSFGERVDTLLAFTSDRDAAATAIDSLTVRGETALYDGVRRAADLASTAAEGDRYIVVLSDGGDTVSVSDLDAAVQAATDARVPVYAVTLESPEYDPAPLQVIAQRSGGKSSAVSDTAALGVLFEEIALELSNRYTVTYVSAEPATADMEVSLVATGSRGTAVASTVFKNPALAAAGAESAPAGDVTPASGFLGSRIAYTGTVALVFISVTLLGIGVLMLVAPKANVLEQVHYYEQLHADLSPEDAMAVVRTDAEAHGRLVDVVDHVLGKRGFKGALREQLERAGLPLRPTEYMYFHILGVIIVGVVTQVGFNRAIVSAAAILFAVFLPIALLQARVSRRGRAFEAQLPDVLSLIAGSLRAGWGIQQSMDLVVQEAGEPSRSEFRRVQSETRLGLPLEEALGKMAERVDSDDFRWTVAAITIQREVGGNLAEVLDIVAHTIRERADLRREVHALTAEGRLSAGVLTVLPFFVFSAMLFVNPGYMGRLLSTPLGVAMLFSGLVLLVVGLVWVNAAIRIEV